ncbi:scavenger receptor cysteine-rich domain superfamily protein-like isoform X2 [Argopecten irradians]|uniref:scavenger receptor cysteine-rich domain superfamily protein-like isoform X2 n=1 Tax=Argopecten irradians TaxID=31199 RepID=UPI003723DE69
MLHYSYLILTIVTAYHSIDGVTASSSPATGIRLMDEMTNSSGRVEVFLDGQWGNVCGEQWNYNNAKVACGMLGYSNGAPITYDYSAESGPILLVVLYCDGSELSLQDCRSAERECFRDVAGVICYSGFQASDIEIRLTGGPSPNVGRVDVYYAGYWGTICGSDGWDDKDAAVTCRMFGYGTGQHIYNNDYGQLAEPVWMGGVDCVGTEDSLFDCLFDGWGNVPYCSNYPATVYCYNITASPDFRLTGGSAPNVGRIDVYYNGVWGSICGTNDWDYRDAKVACRMFGYSAGRSIYRSKRYGDVTEPVWMAGVDCVGTEKSLADCPFDGWGAVGFCISSPATVFCYNTTESGIAVRLTGGTEPNVGRVEVYYSGYWGTICGFFSWDDNDAIVTCRMLGYSAGYAIYPSRSYGLLSEPIWMGGVGCLGSETSLADCPFNGWGRVDLCTPATVSCYEKTNDAFKVRLTGSSEPHVGRVEVYYSGIWGTICGYNDWDLKDAIVTCGMLGYSTGRPICCSRNYGDLTEIIWMNGVDCTGTENSLADCPFDGWGQISSCNTYAAGLFCYNVTGDSIDVRLTGGSEPNIGQVEVYYSGYWGTICDWRDWDDTDANVTCRMLGYSTGVSRFSRSYGKLTEPVWMGGVDCYGTEESLADCSFDGWGQVGDCGAQAASVFCYNLTGEDISVRLTGGSEPHVGRVEVFYSGYWGTICGDNDWDFRDANVTCRMLGFSTGRAIYHATQYGLLAEPVWMNDVDCNGSEDSLADCSFEGWGRCSDCYYHQYPASVFCYNLTVNTSVEIRLLGGSNESTGVVEVYYGGHWGSVCTSKHGFDNSSATVACRMLNYRSGKALPSVLGYTKEPFWMMNVRCSGTESSLTECPFDGWGMVWNCDYQALVICHDPLGMACRCLMLSAYWEIDLKYHWSNTTGGIVYTLTGRKLSQTDCAAVCMYNSDCLMFGYSKVTGTCHGFRYLEHSPVSILEESQVIYKHTQCCHLRGYIWMEDGPLCVKIHNNRSTWDNAKTQCEQDHGRLAILDDAKKYQAFINYGNMDNVCKFSTVYLHDHPRYSRGSDHLRSLHPWTIS